MYDEIGQPIMECDGILLYQNKAFLCESKHKMTQLNSHAYLMNKNLELKQLSYKEFIGVACGSLLRRI
ncbi:2635_t:CDS:2 [Funneliformis caledonium]|uniref:2635_t:CDS:1 n=1 Tax=Funneliformis caledonium TaxID=1117310 RepID=A0A9N8YPB9_9GLOM|nr:2635_t:CDS:2 [Funneliformis caledonium]